jgi:hypothetical protein
VRSLLILVTARNGKIWVESVPHAQQSADLNQMLTGADMLRVTLHWNVPECDVSTLYDTSRGLYLGHTVKFIHSFKYSALRPYTSLALPHFRRWSALCISPSVV